MLNQDPLGPPVYLSTGGPISRTRGCTSTRELIISSKPIPDYNRVGCFRPSNDPRADRRISNDENIAPFLFPVRRSGSGG